MKFTNLRDRLTFVELVYKRSGTELRLKVHKTSHIAEQANSNWPAILGGEKQAPFPKLFFLAPTHVQHVQLTRARTARHFIVTNLIVYCRLDKVDICDI